MPEQFNPLSEYVINLQGEFPFVERDGREIFEELSYTGLNQSPINKLSAFILAGVTPQEELPVETWSVDDTCERLLVDGSIVCYWEQGKDPEGEFLQDLVKVTKAKVIQAVHNEDDPSRPIVRDRRRRYELMGGHWEIALEEYTSDGWRPIGQVVEAPLESLFVFPNKRGILWPAQLTYWRMESIERTMQGQTGKSALAMVISGFTGDIQQAESQFQKIKTGEVTAVFIPGNVVVTPVSPTQAVQNLLSDMQQLLQFYKERTYDYDIPESQESGVSRRLKMGPMLQFVKRNRAHLTTIYKERWGAELVFDKVQLDTVQDRTAEFALQIQMRDEEVLEGEDFTERALDLVN